MLGVKQARASYAKVGSEDEKVISLLLLCGNRGRRPRFSRLSLPPPLASRAPPLAKHPRSDTKGQMRHKYNQCPKTSTNRIGETAERAYGFLKKAGQIPGMSCSAQRRVSREIETMVSISRGFFTPSGRSE